MPVPFSPNPSLLWLTSLLVRGSLCVLTDKQAREARVAQLASGGVTPRNSVLNQEGMHAYTVVWFDHGWLCAVSSYFTLNGACCMGVFTCLCAVCSWEPDEPGAYSCSRNRLWSVSAAIVNTGLAPKNAILAMNQAKAGNGLVCISQ